MRLMFWIGVAAAVVFTLSSEALIDLLYGDSYRGAGQVLTIHAWAGAFASLGVASGPWFVNSGMLKFRMAHTMAGAALNIGFNLLLIPQFGVGGAAVATLVSQVFTAFLFNGLMRRTWPIFALQARSILIR